MTKTLIFGNSGSGKSTLAQKLCAAKKSAHLDLDTLAWLPTSPPERAPLPQSLLTINRFIQANSSWVIEGCYTDLLELVATEATKIIFLDLSIADCIANAKKRPWEPHKYPSKQAQDANLLMLIEWIKQYKTRQDDFSYARHYAFFQQYSGNKITYQCNQ